LKSLLQIEYNQETGEVSLVDPNGIVSPDDYKNLMQTLTGRKPSGAVGVSSPTANDDDLHLVNPDDLEDGDVIDAVIEIVPGDDVIEEVSATEAVSTEATTTAATFHQYHHTQPTEQHGIHNQHHHQQHQQQEQAQGYDHYAAGSVQPQQQHQQPQYHYQSQPTQQQHQQAQAVATAVPHYSTQTQPLYQLQLLQEQENIMQATHHATMQQFQQQYQQQQPSDQSATGYVENTTPPRNQTPQSGGWGFDHRRNIWIG
jgi:hypothetical protein